MKKCNYCGQENEDNAITCSGCGNELAAVSQSETDRELSDPALSPVVVATFSSLQEASLMVGRLQAAGIEALVPEEYSEQVFSAVIPLARFTVRVAARDYGAAVAVLAEGAEAQPARASQPKEQTGVGERPAEQPGVDTEAPQKRCVSCDALIPYEATICPKCGWTQPSRACEH